MELTNLLSEMDALVVKGQIPTAVDKFFADDATTSDFSGVTTDTKAAMLEKMSGFLGGIQTVNGITLHQALAGKTVTMSEYTFDFDMKDGSHILWHEIIHRTWKDGKVIKEQYFTN